MTQLTTASNWVTVAKADDVREGCLTRADAGFEPLILTRLADSLVCVGGTCPHAGASLGDGELAGQTITCPAHGSVFDVCTGQVLQAPATTSLPSYQVRVVDGDVQIDSPKDKASPKDIASPKDKAMLWTQQTWDPEAAPDWVRESYQQVLPYVTAFLPGSHPYRAGPVCPFVPGALRRDRISFAEGVANGDAKQQAERLRECVDAFLSGKQGFSALLVLLPEDYDIAELVETHRLMKEYCVRRQLMLGALWPSNQAPSLHSEDYFPLRTPVPSLVVRDMVVGDLRFLDPDHYSMFRRLVFLRAFMRKFREQASRSGAEVTEYDKARSLARQYVIQIALRIVAATGFTGFVAAVAWRARKKS